MKMKTQLLTTLIVVMGLITACKNGGGAGGAKAELKTEEDKIFYSVGHRLGARFQEMSLNEQEAGALARGVYESATGKKSDVDTSVYMQKAQKHLQERIKKMADENKKKGVDFLENFVKSEGGQKTASGLAFKVTKEGSGKKPGAEDIVTVHYEGKLIDGTIFDSSKKRNKEVKFPLNRVIKGWTEGLQLVGEGGSVKLVIPPDLGYGEAGAPPKIPGGSVLVFEVDLIKVQTKEEAEAESAPKK